MAIILVTAAVLAAPLATISTWAEDVILDTDYFTTAMVPLAKDPDIQELITTRVQAAIEDEVDLEAVVDEAITSIVGDDTAGALTRRFLHTPVTDGLRSLIRATTHAAIASEAFPLVFEASVRQGHSRLIGALDSGSGLSIDIGSIVALVKTRLLEQGQDFIRHVPQVDLIVPLVDAQALATTRQGYLIATTAGSWLPWVFLVASVGGVVAARNRRRAATAVGIGVALTMAVLIAAVWIGRGQFIAAASRALIPESTALVLLAPFTQPLIASAGFLAAVGLVLVVAARLAPRPRPTDRAPTDQV